MKLYLLFIIILDKKTKEEEFRYIYLKLGTFLTKYENMLNNYISCINCILIAIQSE